MKHLKTTWLIFILVISLWSCKEEVISPLGDTTVEVFENANLYFDMAFKSGPSPIQDSILRLDAGRVILKKVKIPSYKLQTKATVQVLLTSNGDPWDKSGSLFVIPVDTELSLLDFEDGSFDLAQRNETYPAITPFSKDSLHYIPNVELLRFMTPFGVGHFNDSERIKDRKPIYIPHWEEEVTWSQDISHLLPLLQDEVYIGVFIDTWTKEGYNISVALDFDESDFPNHTGKKQGILPLVNTIKYASAQRLFDSFSKDTLTVDFSINTPFKNAKLHYITTGHGGHGGGDEFVKKENQITLDGTLIKSFIPWRDDCASFRRFNPTSATWPANVIMKEETSTEHIASSDFSRSNWCPGSDVVPEVIPLENLTPGDHKLTIAIPEAQVATETENNYWMVSAYITYDLE